MGKKQLDLVSERNGWLECFKSGVKPHRSMIDEYKANRDSNYWRKSKFVEIQCEYVLFLESEVERLNDIVNRGK